MKEAAFIFVTLGGTFLLGLAADAFGRRTRFPRVTMLLILGFLVGPAGFDLFPAGYETIFQSSAAIALTMVGFLLGERLVHAFLGGEARWVLIISSLAVLATGVVVFFGLWVLGVSLPAALLLAGISTATAPAATTDVVRQMGAEGKFVDTLLGVVAVDDAWGLLAFSLLMAAAKMVGGDAGDVLQPIVDGFWELGGAVLIGGGLGAIMAFLTGRIDPGEPSLLEAMGFVFLACGLAIWVGTSFILTAMIMGAVVARLAKHHNYPFHQIELIELPFMILFFVFAGASLDVEALGAIGWTGGAYILFRVVGRLVGGWCGGRIAGADQVTRQEIGLALMPQAGVALGMALLAEQAFPEDGRVVLQIAIGSTVLFELVGPLLTRRAVLRAQAISADSA